MHDPHDFARLLLMLSFRNSHCRHLPYHIMCIIIHGVCRDERAAKDGNY